MNGTDSRYQTYSLVQEMLETPAVIRKIDVERIRDLAGRFKADRFLLTGEGSSRIMPAGKVRYDAMRSGYRQIIQSEGALQACEYDLDGYTVCVASNSGRTREGVVLLKSLEAKPGVRRLAVVGNASSPIGESAEDAYELVSGPEKAVAATKTVVEQALFYDMFFRLMNDAEMPDLTELAGLFEEVLSKPVPEEIIERLSSAGTLYWSGRTDGVAAELSLKTNEITRKPSDFLEGTYAVHGIEEVMDPEDALVAVAPFPDEETKMSEVLEQGVGMKIFAIGPAESEFPGVQVPDLGPDTPYLEIAAGWNLLVEIGLRIGIDLDKPVRARKVGNEFRS
jgi:glucosamine--fructose-6-phosphate aminotransferase (isomerizing)